ncbi:mitotic-spindle organizing protein 1 [Nematocida major]|uniref:mitotic-spindle organizing protein 1 n=1 Tax=Nematocida major TaxID=1912982 RepID=UPI002007676C|nr:mitotic-spindle organizing protein 1 [Nematocida major]KAH9386638.1 mitotic-spindle organizing protein 1 [Nematocida major]
MRIEETIQEANKIIESGLSPELLKQCSRLLADSTVSCEGVILLLKELRKEVDAIEQAEPPTRIE